MVSQAVPPQCVPVVGTGVGNKTGQDKSSEPVVLPVWDSSITTRGVDWTEAVKKGLLRMQSSKQDRTAEQPVCVIRTINFRWDRRGQGFDSADNLSLSTPWTQSSCSSFL